MRTILKWLDGRKTYLGLIAAGILGIFWTSGRIDDKLAETLAVLIATWTGISLRAAMGKAPR